MKRDIGAHGQCIRNLAKPIVTIARVQMLAKRTIKSFPKPTMRHAMTDDNYPLRRIKNTGSSCIPLLFAVTAMLVTYALESRSHWFILAFAGACVLGSIYRFLQGAWPFGLVEAIWAVVAVRRWYLRIRR